MFPLGYTLIISYIKIVHPTTKCPVHIETAHSKTFWQNYTSTLFGDIVGSEILVRHLDFTCNLMYYSFTHVKNICVKVVVRVLSVFLILTTKLASSELNLITVTLAKLLERETTMRLSSLIVSLGDKILRTDRTLLTIYLSMIKKPCKQRLNT